MNKKYRLKKNYEFNYVYKRGMSFACREFIFYYAKDKKKRTRVGFSVSKKIGKSVKRNKCKRILREAFRLSLEKVKKENSYIVVARQDLLKASFQSVLKSIEYALKKTNNLV